MDYHLDWLYAALILATAREGNGVYPSPGFPRKDGSKFNVNTNQEDIDLLIAFEDDETTRLVLIEAKGVTTFGNPQLESKARRLRVIFGEKGTSFPNVEPHFILASPVRPAIHSDTHRLGLNLDEIPEWMHDKGDFRWMRLPVSASRLEIVRCNSEGQEAPSNDYWRVRERAHANDDPGSKLPHAGVHRPDRAV